MIKQADAVGPEFPELVQPVASDASENVLVRGFSGHFRAVASRRQILQIPNPPNMGFMPCSLWVTMIGRTMLARNSLAHVFH